MTEETTESPQSNPPLGLGCNDGLGLVPERAEFEAWLVQKGGWVAVPEKRANGTYVNGQTQARWLGWKAAWDSQQARIDRLMLEWCPDEMTPHQMAEWSKHQVAAPGFDEAALDAAPKA